MKRKNVIHRRPRRKHFYYEIHLRGGYVVQGRALWSGMLEAEREVEQKAGDISAKVGRPQRGFIIIKLGRKSIPIR